MSGVVAFVVAKDRNIGQRTELLEDTHGRLTVPAAILPMIAAVLILPPLQEAAAVVIPNKMMICVVLIAMIAMIGEFSVQ